MIRKLMSSKILSLAISSALVATSIAEPVRAAMAVASPLPDFVRTLTPPSRLGYLENYFQGATKNPVILIQDLHANYGVQKKISELLKHLQAKINRPSLPMVIGVEAAWKNVDLSYTKKHDPKIRLKVDDYLMKEAEMTGMEHFAVMSEQPVQLVGIDDETAYQMHGALVRKSAGVRLSLAYKVDQMSEALTKARSKAPRSVRKIWKLEDAFQKGSMGLPELARQLQVPSIANYGEAESLLYKRKMALAQELGTDKGALIQNLVRADESLKLLSRLLRQQMTLEEVQFASHQLKEIVAVIQVLFPDQKMEEWEQAIRSAISYYAVALVRDRPLAENTARLLQQHPDAPVVAVTGGFHTAGIAKILREKKISYVVIAPVVESHTTHDEVLYLRRILGDRLTPTDIAKAFKNPRGIPATHTLAVVPNPNAPAIYGTAASIGEGLEPPKGTLTSPGEEEKKTLAAGIFPESAASLKLMESVLDSKPRSVTMSTVLKDQMPKYGNRLNVTGAEMLKLIEEYGFTIDVATRFYASKRNRDSFNRLVEKLKNDPPNSIYELKWLPPLGARGEGFELSKQLTTEIYHYDAETGLRRSGEPVSDRDKVRKAFETAFGALELVGYPHLEKDHLGREIGLDTLPSFEIMLDPKAPTAYTVHKLGETPKIHIPITTNQNLLTTFMLRELSNIVKPQLAAIKDLDEREALTVPIFAQALEMASRYGLYITKEAAIAALRTAGGGYDALAQLLENGDYSQNAIAEYLSGVWAQFGHILLTSKYADVTFAGGVTVEARLNSLTGPLNELSQGAGDAIVARVRNVESDLTGLVTDLEGFVGRKPDAAEVDRIARQAQEMTDAELRSA